MPAKKSTSRTSSRSPETATDAIDLLTEDHRKVDELFEEYEAIKESAEDEDKEQRVAAICLELTVHATVEEELFYPAAREALDPDNADMLDEAEVEHATVRDLIDQLSEMSASDDLYDAKVKVLGEYVRHHVQEEEGEIFPALRDAEIDLAALGADIETRKEELREELEAETAE
jgi:hemerythrin superfamily protein